MTSATTQCPHCGEAHDASMAKCPRTGKALKAAGLIVPRPPGSQPRPVARGRRELLGRTIDGKFKIRDVIGEGGMGSVFEAEQLSIRRPVAIKVLHPAQAKKPVAVKRFHQEARAVGSIGHPNICEVYDMGSLEDGSPYLVLERLTGQTLSARLSAEGRLGWKEAVDVIAQVAAGLTAAHERGILHRDIKPENVFLSQRPSCPAIVKILDFGVSKAMAVGRAARADDFDDETLTKTGMVMGTPYYMAPEQARGERDLDGRVDVYACGVVLYESLTGKRPFQGANYNTLLLSILSGTPTPLRSLEPSVPVALERVVARAMARSRAERFASAQELRDALLAVKDSPAPHRRNDSVDIPISFVDSAEVNLVEMLDEDNPTTTARRVPPLVELLGDEDEEGAGERTQLMTPDELARAVPGVRARSIHDTDPLEPPGHDDEATRTVRREALAPARKRT